MPRFILTELRAASSFTLSEASQCCVPGMWNTQHTWHIANAGKGQLAAIKIDCGTCLFKKSVPSRPAASAGRAHTGNVWVNSRPFSVKLKDCSPFIFMTSPFTPYGLVVVTLTSRLDIPGCKLRDIGASVNDQVSWNPFCFDPNIGSALLNYDRNQ